MKINGLQKLTLLDFPGKTACTVFLAGCNCRCPYCHNSGLLTEEAEAVMEEGELLSFLKKRQGLLEGVAFTGGEPLMRPDLPDLFRAIKALDYPIKLDTNGFFPDRLQKVLEEGLVDYVAMDIKNSPDRYAETVGLPQVNLSLPERSIRLLIDGKIPYEFRTTAVAELHDDDSFRAIGPWISGAGAYFIQAFADRDTVLFSGFHTPEKEQLEHWADLVRPYVGSVSLRGV